MVQAGAAAFKDQRWAEAVDLFKRAESMVHAPTHLLYLARAQDKLGHLVEAHEAYLKIVKEPLPPNPPKAGSWQSPTILTARTQPG